MKVYLAISEVAAKLAKDGISKARKNEQQGYSFRGIDDVYNALSTYLAEAKLCILPHVMSREVVERTTQKGNALFYVTVQVRFDFVSAEDGSKHEVVTYGEAMDSGDKATNKAMSAAYKYAAMQTFCIPTEGDNDADATTHEGVKAKIDIKNLDARPRSGAKAQLNAEQIERIDKVISAVTDWINSGSIADAVLTADNAAMDADESVYFWSQFNSKDRKAMENEHKAQRKKLLERESATQA